MKAAQVFEELVWVRPDPEGDYKDHAAARSSRLEAIAHRFGGKDLVLTDGYSCPRSFSANEEEERALVYSRFLKVWKTLSRKNRLRLEKGALTGEVWGF